jgi:hypothetical protein
MYSLLVKLVGKNFLEKITLISIVMVAFFFRVYELPNDLFVAETHNIFSGLRLHTLGLFNFWDHISDNFFKSFLQSPTYRSPFSVFISSTIYGWLNIPLSEFWLRFFYVCIGTLCVLGTYLLGRQLSDYRLGLIAAAILAINAEQLHVSRWDGAEATVMFISMIFFITLFHYKEHPTWIWRTILSFILPFVASLETIILLPLVIVYQIIFFVPQNSSYAKKVAGCFKYLLSKESILLWLPCFFTLLLHLYVYTRIGMSNIGLFGFMVSSYIRSREVPSLGGLLENFTNNFRTYSHYFINPAFFYSSFAAFSFLAICRKQHKLSKALIISAIGFFYLFTMFSLTASNNKGSHLYISDALNVLFFAAVWISLFDLITKNVKNAQIAHATSFVLYIGLSAVLMAQAFVEYQVVMKRQRLITPLKSIGYYIHEYGGGNPTAYLLLKCGGTPVYNAEFYFGTQMMDMEKDYGLKRKLFCMASKSVEETLSAYKLTDFDFYVAVYGYSGSDGRQKKDPYVNLRTPQIDSKVQGLLAKGVKRVAVIKKQGLIMGEIFSRRNLPFKDMEINKYDPLWDQKYANISGIIKTKWSGQASIWGYGYNQHTGLPYGYEKVTDQK